MKIEELLNMCSGPEGDFISILIEAVKKTGDAYRAEYSSDKMADFEVASRAFDQKFDQLSKKYNAEISGNKDESVSWGDFEETKNRSQVFRFLQSLGYNIKSRTFQRHCKTGLVQKSESGLFTKKLTRDYIRSQGLLSEKEDVSEPTMEQIAERKEYESEKIKYQAAREKLKYQREKGLLGSKVEFNLEMAARLAFADNFLRGFGEQYSGELIAICGGNQDRRDDFSLFWIEKFDHLMREFSKPLNFKIIFKNEC